MVDQRSVGDPAPDWLPPLRSVPDGALVSVSCRVAELPAGICADCPLVIVPALPLSLGVETPLLPLRPALPLLRAESESELCDGLEPAAVVLPAKLGAAAAMSRAAVAITVDSLVMRCSMLVKA
jgi:hypothetical protein